MLALGVFAATLVTRITDPLVAVLAHDLDATAARVALLASAFALPFALIQPILGPVGDALGKRRIIAVGLSLLSVILLASSLAPSLDVLLALRALAGLSAGGVMPLSIAMIGDSVPLKDRQVALSRLLAFAIRGQIAGGSVAGLLEPALGWRGVMIAAGAVAATAVLAILAGGRALPPETRQRFDPVLAYVSVAIGGMLVFGSFPYFAPLLQARGLGSAAEAGLAVAAFGCGGLLTLASLLSRQTSHRTA